MAKMLTVFAHTPRLLLALPLVLLASCAAMSPQQGSKVSAETDHSAPTGGSAQADEVVMYAFSLMGDDYRYGGDDPEGGLDCSGLVSYVYRNAAGIKLPHNASEIAQMGRVIDPSALRPGDLVFFNTMDRPYSHVGIYIGGGRFIHAPNSNRKITIGSLKSDYYAKRLEAARSFFH